MVCYRPIHGYMSRSPNRNGKYYFTTRLKEGDNSNKMAIPCGQCIGCKIQKAKSWTGRIVHEASLYDDNCFVTLTFASDFIDRFGSLYKRPFQLFMKKLRKDFPDRRIRYYMAGEYGSRLRRPHYHLCLFNLDFPDKEFFRKSKGNIFYTSKILSSLWTCGFHDISEVNSTSAAYVAGYVTKKINVPNENHIDYEKYKNHYRRVDFETGEVKYVMPEFNLMSRARGIGYDWIRKNYKDVYPDDLVFVNNKKLAGLKLKPSKFYDSIYDEITNELYEVKERRKQKLLEKKDLYSEINLRAKEEFALRRFNKSLKLRVLENG